MTKLFLSAWLLYALIFVIMPFRLPAHGNPGALAIVCSFIALAGLSYALAYRLVRLPEANFRDLKSFHWLIWIGIGLSTLGFALLIYDRVVVQKIDFSFGLAYARAQWTDFGRDRQGPSSIFSVLGYLIGSTYFASLVMALTRMDLLTRRQLAAILFAVFLLAMLNSAITGGRTTLLLLVSFVLCALVLRGRGGLRERLSGQMFRRGSYALAAVIFAYVTYVTLDRAWNADISMETYLVESIAYLHMEMNGWYIEHLRHSALSNVSAPIVYIGAYLTHSYAILCEIADAPHEDKVILFAHWLGLISKLGLVDPPQGDWFLVGRFPSLPGALWHQFGATGLAVGSVLLGGVSAVSVRCYRACPDFVLFQGFQTCCATILMISPLMFAADFMVFPFIVVGFGLMAVIQIAFARGIARAA
jgi:oligosaccharide repeat unit polymerase